MDYQLIDSVVHQSAKIYQGARIQKSTLKRNTVVGNFSRIDFSNLAEFCRVDRNNHLFHTTMKKRSYTGIGTVILHADIGAFCSISWNVSIGGANHDYSRMTQHSFLYNPYDEFRPNNEPIPYDRFKNSVQVGNDVWIAAGAIITRGVKIGDGAVIGANAVVTKDVPPYAIVGGVPAKVIKYRFPSDVIHRLLEIKWWDWSDEKIKTNFHLLADQPTLDKLKDI